MQQSGSTKPINLHRFKNRYKDGDYAFLVIKESACVQYQCAPKTGFPDFIQRFRYFFSDLSENFHAQEQLQEMTAFN